MEWVRAEKPLKRRHELQFRREVFNIATTALWHGVGGPQRLGEVYPGIGQIPLQFLKLLGIQALEG